ncbi:MAG: extracellular solute-binding protein [Rhizobiaceae bacterium]|jgi:ABC-type glycerol-3-phosphate transport system substrate-binding protein|nr:extracellular solute-binding protein [Rhizobiaceae bacterium]
MRKLTKALLTSVIVMLGAGSAMADCGIEKGSVRILGNDFPAIQAVTKAAAACATGTVEVKTNLTKDHESLAVAALTANPAEYTSQIVANSSILPLLNDGLIRPLDDLVAKYGQGLSKNQLITIDGKVMAVAFMANAQHLFYREDILTQAGVAVPTTYEGVLEAAKAIKDKGLMQYPLGGTYKAGWNLGEEFVNMYLGYGGAFFAEGSANPAINNEKGVAALEMMKALSAHMNPDFLTFDSNALQAEFEAGKVAMANFWGSRAGAVTDAEGSTPEVTAAIKFAGAPTVAGGSIPATTLWWDGFTIAKNISDEDAEATFRALINGVTSEMANANPDAAVWLIQGFTPGALAGGVLASASANATPYPMQPYAGLMHNALGAELVEFMQGKEDAAKALADTEAAYIAAAKEAGFIK